MLASRPCPAPRQPDATVACRKRAFEAEGGLPTLMQNVTARVAAVVTSASLGRASRLIKAERLFQKLADGRSRAKYDMEATTHDAVTEILNEHFSYEDIIASRQLEAERKKANVGEVYDEAVDKIMAQLGRAVFNGQGVAAAKKAAAIAAGRAEADRQKSIAHIEAELSAMLRGQAAPPQRDTRQKVAASASGGD